MDVETILLKKKIRGEVKELLLRMTPEARREQSLAVCNKLKGSSLWKNSERVLAYAPMNCEVNIWNLVIKGIGSGKIIALPFYVKECDIYEARIVRDLNKDIVKGKLGIREPDEKCEKIGFDEFDLILVPGVAFSRNGYRLGRGKGYYDRMLVEVKGIKCGICFECQFGWEVPVEPHDVKLDCIITPSLWWWSWEASGEENE
jgi:5-formyltetrahydrofolate cyclo-ligase